MFEILTLRLLKFGHPRKCSLVNESNCTEDKSSLSNIGK